MLTPSRILFFELLNRLAISTIRSDRQETWPGEAAYSSIRKHSAKSERAALNDTEITPSLSQEKVLSSTKCPFALAGQAILAKGLQARGRYATAVLFCLQLSPK